MAAASSPSKRVKQTALDTMPWVEKYRPSSLDDLISHDHIVSTLDRLIDANRLPHLLLYGPPGTGKTSTILAAARRMYGSASGSMVLELNASDDRGIGVVRNEIKEFAGTKKLFSSGTKLVILDEADAMTNDAQLALRRVIEKYTRNTRFCLICNYVNKIIPALQSRCTRFRFAPLDPEQIRGRLRNIVEAEGVTVTPDGEEALLRLAGGDMRRVLNVLQAAHMAYDHVDEAHVYLCVGNPLPQDVQQIVEWLLNASFSDACRSIAEMTRTKGYALTDILTDVAKYAMLPDFGADVRAYLLDELSQLEFRLATATSPALQLAALVGVFVLAREKMAAAAMSGSGSGAGSSEPQPMEA